MKRKKTCRYHCSGCDRHFTSSSAFEAHRVGSFDSPEDPRRCEAPWEVVDDAGHERLDQELGECRLTGEIRSDIEIWHLSAQRAGLAEWRSQAAEPANAA